MTRLNLLLAGCAALVLTHSAAYAIGRSHGVEAEKRAEAKRLEQAQKAIAKREAKAEQVTDKVADQLTETRAEIRYRTQYLVKEVPTYVTPEADRSCTVPLGFVRLHDAAASGSEASLPGASGGSVDAPSGVELSAVAETVAANYGTAFGWRAEALAWREWYEQQKAAWER